jgi:hypothetical protein
MNSIDKTFSVLEYIFNKDGVPSTPPEVASAIGHLLADHDDTPQQRLYRESLQACGLHTRAHAVRPECQAVALRHDVDSVVETLGFPKEQWDGIHDRESFYAELERIAKRKIIKYQQHGAWIIRGLVEVGTLPRAAIGFGARTAEKVAEAVELLKKAIADIESQVLRWKCIKKITQSTGRCF